MTLPTASGGSNREHQGPRAVLNAVDRLASAYRSECVRIQQDLSIAEAQFRDYQARLGKPFTLELYLSELTSLRDQLKAGLSGTAHEPGKEEEPSVSELAEKIKVLKAAHSPVAANRRGINHTDWCPIDKATYDACVDPRDYRPKP